MFQTPACLSAYYQHRVSRPAVVRGPLTDRQAATATATAKSCTIQQRFAKNADAGTFLGMVLKRPVTTVHGVIVVQRRILGTLPVRMLAGFY